MSTDAVILLIVAWIASLGYVAHIQSKHWSAIVHDLQAEIERLRDQLEGDDDDDEEGER